MNDNYTILIGKKDEEYFLYYINFNEEKIFKHNNKLEIDGNKYFEIVSSKQLCNKYLFNIIPIYDKNNNKIVKEFIGMYFMYGINNTFKSIYFNDLKHLYTIFSNNQYEYIIEDMKKNFGKIFEIIKYKIEIGRAHV